MAEKPKSPSKSPSSRLPWRRRLVWLLLILVVGSVAARVFYTKQREEKAAPSTSPAGTTTLLPGQPPPPQEPAPEPTAAEKALPYVTEGGIAMLLGLALGVATRSFLRIGLILIAVTFVIVQYLSYKGMLTVDWKAIEDFVLNIPKKTGISEVVKYKLPSAGSLLMGYYLGLRRG